MRKFWKLISSFDLIRQRAGLLSAVKVTAKKGFSYLKGAPENRLEELAFVSEDEPIGYQSEFGPDNNIITWLVPDFYIGAGGHTTIFRAIDALEKVGYVCKIIILGKTYFPTPQAARNCIIDSFFPLKASIDIGEAYITPSWVVVATSWQTAYTLRRIASTKHKLYFVQDFEPAFYPASSYYVLAENTYKFGFQAITAGSWLEDIMRQKYGLAVSSFGFGVDHNIYYMDSAKPVGGPIRVFFYARPVTERRGFEIGILALQKLKQSLPSVQIVIAGWNLKGYAIPFKYEHCGICPPDKLGDIFRSCHIGLVLSLTNVSLLPLELMACGCAVVVNGGRNNEWLLNNKVALISKTCANSIAGHILQLCNDESMRRQFQLAGQKFALEASWGVELNKITDEFNLLRSGRHGEEKGENQ